MRVYQFPNFINPKVKVNGEMGIEPASYDVAVEHVGNSTTGTHQKQKKKDDFIILLYI